MSFLSILKKKKGETQKEEEIEEGKIRINVNTLTKNALNCKHNANLIIDPNINVEELKLIIEKKLHFPPSQQELSLQSSDGYSKISLVENLSLAEQNIVNNSIIRILLSTSYCDSLNK